MSARINDFINKLIQIAGSEEYLTLGQKEKISHFIRGNILELRIDSQLSLEDIEYYHKAEGPDFDTRNFLTFSSCQSMRKQVFCELGHALQNHCGHEYKHTPYSVINTKIVWVIK